MISSREANKVVQMVQIDKRVELAKLELWFNDARREALHRSDAVKKVKASVHQNMKSCIRNFEEKDFNKDGHVNVDGFVAALLHSEFKLKSDDLKEAFHLCSEERELNY